MTFYNELIIKIDAKDVLPIINKASLYYDYKK